MNQAWKFAFDNAVKALEKACEQASERAIHGQVEVVIPADGPLKGPRRPMAVIKETILASK